MFKIYISSITQLIQNNKEEHLLNEITEVSSKRKDEKKAGEILLLRALKDLGIEIIKPLEYEYYNGKPYLKEKYAFYNISHTDDLIVLAISDQEVGIDIEKTNRRSKINKKNNDPNYLKTWTIKEAGVKYLGTGIKDLKKVKLENGELYINNQKLLHQTFTIHDSFITVVYKEATNIEITRV